MKIIHNANSEGNPTCELALAQAPVVNGLRLGMTLDEVLTLFPGSKDDGELRSQLTGPPSQFGNSSFVISPAKYGPNKKHEGITQISLGVLDGRISSFTVGYAGPEYSHVDKFVAKFVEGKNLPPLDQWEPYVGMDNQLKILNCAEFEVRVFAGGQGGNLNYVSVKDLAAEKKLKDRRAKARAKAALEAGSPG